MLLLLMQQPLMEGLLEQGLRGLRRGPALLGLGALRWLLGAPPARSGISALEGGHVLLLHLEVVLVLEPLLQSGSGLLLGDRTRVTGALRSRGPAGLLRRRTPAHGGRLHPGLSHEPLTLRRLRLLELTVIHHLLLLRLLLLLLLLLKMSPHQQLSELGAVEIPHLWPLALHSSADPLLLLLLLLQSCDLLLL